MIRIIIDSNNDYWNEFMRNNLEYCGAQLLRRLNSEGLNSVTEEHLLRMKEILMKVQRHKIAMYQNKQMWNDQGAPLPLFHSFIC